VSRNVVVEPPQPPPLPPDERPRRRSQASGGEPPRWKTILPIALGGAPVLLGVLLGAVAMKMMRDKSSFSDALVKTLVYVPAPQAVFGKDRIYVMLLGIDYDYDSKDQPYSSSARSDTIMAAGLDFPSKSAKLVSVLRDTEAQYNGKDTKINQAYSDGGVKLADGVIGDFLGMPALAQGGRHFDRYVVVKINAVKDFVNAIGGIDVPVTETMNYDDSWGHLHIHFKPGLVHMNGEDAQGYARFRHDACSDPCRSKRQQQVIHIVIQKLKNEKLNDLTHIGQLISVFKRDVQTNLSNDELKSLGWAFKDANIADLSHADVIPYVDTKIAADGGEVVIPDEHVKAKLVGDLLGAYGNVTPPPASALAAIKPTTVHLVVQNGSGEPGLAGTAAAKLRKAGYVIDSVGNADAFSYDATQIRPAAKIPFVGERVRRDLGVDGAAVIPATDTTPGPRSVVTVIVGKDFSQAAAVPAVGPTSSAAPLHK
jgi:polyisoprenyl-teichoic acid--peptidoglycan teichoic acid transferase